MSERDERDESVEDRANEANRSDAPGQPDEFDEPPVSAAAVEIARRLAGARAYIHALPSTERRIATMAADGQPVWAIAQTLGISEAAVSRTLDGVLAAVEGRELSSVETGGLGADTDPGVTGGYGDTGFGALDTEPIPDSSEPVEGAGWLAPRDDEEEE
jgi:hypothetical protein